MNSKLLFLGFGLLVGVAASRFLSKSPNAIPVLAVKNDDNFTGNTVLAYDRPSRFQPSGRSANAPLAF